MVDDNDSPSNNGGVNPNESTDSTRTPTADESRAAWKVAKDIIEKDIKKGKIPLDTKEMGPREVYAIAEHQEVFKLVKYTNFATNLNKLRKKIKEDKSNAEQDDIFLKHDRKIHPKPAYTASGQPRWQGSEAQKWLLDDMKADLHKKYEPQDLYYSRNEYQEFLLKTFRGHIEQQERKWKFLTYLEYKQRKEEEEKREALDTKIDKEEKKRQAQEKKINDAVKKNKEREEKLMQREAEKQEAKQKREAKQREAAEKREAKQREAAEKRKAKTLEIEEIRSKKKRKAEEQNTEKTK